jgi:exosortase C (VPDSG-CTERM-specific)
MKPTQTGSAVSDTQSNAASWPELTANRRRGYAWYSAIVTLLFSQPLASLASYAIGDDLHSYIPLVPFIAGYLFYFKPLRRSDFGSSFAGALLVGIVGASTLAAGMTLRASVSTNDYLSLMTLAYVCFIVSGGLLFLGSKTIATAALPLGFLFFMIPVPDAAVTWLEHASVLGSTEVAAALFNLTGTPMLREGTLLTLPSITLHVAQECSGIRSSWVLLITSVLASHLFLHNSWRRVVLVAFVFPLALLRNGFRILVIGLLCVHLSPRMIDSFIHHRGGPIFFALSLVPLYGLIVWLRRQERPR